MLISTWETPEPPSDCGPQKPTVAQPAFQPAVEYSPLAAGKEKVALGSVVSYVKVRVEGVSVLPTESRARTRMV